MESQEFMEWEKVRQKGILRYIFKYGALFALGYAYLVWSSVYAYKATTGFDIVGISITSVIGGIAMSAIFWYRKEIPYQYIKRKQNLD